MTATAYQYRAATSAGDVIEGVLQAASEPAALEELRRQRLYPIEVVPVKAGARATGRSVGRAEALALFARTLATLLSAGVTLERAVAFAAAQSPRTDLASASRDVHRDLVQGASLAQALARHPGLFDPVVVAMAAAGEESGALDEALTQLATQLEQSAEVRAQIQSGVVYPALVAAASGFGVVVLLLFVVPRFVAILDTEGAALPLSTRVLVGTSQLIVQSWWALLLLAVMAAFAVRAWLAQPANRTRWHGWRLRWPLTGELELKYATAQFARALSMLLRSGKPVPAALRAARATVGNLALAQEIDRATEAVSHGRPVHAALQTALPPLATELIGVGEESGRLDELCLQIARTYDGEVHRSVRTVVSLLEPAMILLFGGIVGFVALAMLQAIYSINRSIF